MLIQTLVIIGVCLYFIIMLYLMVKYEKQIEENLRVTKSHCAYSACVILYALFWPIWFSITFIESKLLKKK